MKRNLNNVLKLKCKDFDDLILLLENMEKSLCVRDKTENLPSGNTA